MSHVCFYVVTFHSLQGTVFQIALTLFLNVLRKDKDFLYFILQLY
jgi:hypothetical protein